jgi:hypothetical protein
MCEGNVIISAEAKLTAVDDDDGRLKHAATAMYLHRQ